MMVVLVVAALSCPPSSPSSCLTMAAIIIAIASPSPMMRVVSAPAAAAAPNVLYLVSDDLRPELGAYGQRQMKTPNIDKLAADGTVFLNVFCQQAVCGPSRASFMTSRRPHHTRVFGNGADFRVEGLDASGTAGANWVTMPQHFLLHGYTTLGGGKTYHPDYPPNWDGPRSWSQDMEYYPFSYWIQPNKTSAYAGGSCPAGPDSSKVCAPCPGPGKPRPTNFSVFASDTWCHLDEPDEHFYDHGLASNTIARLEFAASLFHNSSTPFFIMSGMARPHMPQRMPRRFWDLYDPDALPLATHKLPPQMMPGIAYFQVHDSLACPRGCCCTLSAVSAHARVLLLLVCFSLASTTAPTATSSLWILSRLCQMRLRGGCAMLIMRASAGSISRSGGCSTPLRRIGSRT
jgi:hypothetical protein